MGAGAWDLVTARGTDPDRLRQAVDGSGALRRDTDGADRFGLVDVVTRWADLGVVAATAGRPGWPAGLGRVGPDVVPWVAWRGTPALSEGTPAVAVVGARRASPYGREVAAWIAGEVARAGATIVSGGALGIDAAAHEAALAAGGRTVVVLGCGHGVPYPGPHAVRDGLFDRVVAGGGTVLSAHLPWARPRPARVRARNQVVAALADVVVVVEGAERSGTLVTARFAADLGVDVLAVPGDVRAPLSAAPHQLLHEGAGPCRSPDDVVALLGMSPPTVADPTGPAGAATGSRLPAAALVVLASSWPRPVPIDHLAAAAGVEAAGLLGALTRARIAGEITQEPGGVRLRRRPDAAAD